MKLIISQKWRASKGWDGDDQRGSGYQEKGEGDKTEMQREGGLKWWEGGEDGSKAGASDIETVGAENSSRGLHYRISKLGRQLRLVRAMG